MFETRWTPADESQTKSASQSWWLQQLVTQQPWVPPSCKDTVKKTQTDIQVSPITFHLLLMTTGARTLDQTNPTSQIYQLSQPHKRGVRGNCEGEMSSTGHPKSKASLVSRLECELVEVTHFNIFGAHSPHASLRCTAVGRLPHGQETGSHLKHGKTLN